jgi:predicted amidohydrolase
MNITLVQMESELFNKTRNLEKIIRYIDQGIERGSNMIVFPELCLTGYDCKNKFRKLAEPIPGASTETVEKKIRGKEIYIVFGMAEVAGDNLYNSAAIFGPEGLIDVCRKNYLPHFISATTGVTYDETKYFRPGSEVTIFSSIFGKIGVQICLDLYYPAICRTQALEGAFMFVNISAGPLGSAKINQLFARVRAFEDIGWFVYVNTAGRQGIKKYDGGSCIVDSEGNIRKSASLGKRSCEEVIDYNIDSESICRRRKEFPLLRMERLELLRKPVNVLKKSFLGDI